MYSLYYIELCSLFAHIVDSFILSNAFSAAIEIVFFFSFLFYPDISIVLTASVHRQFVPTQESDINYYSSFPEKGEGLGKGPNVCTRLSSWDRCKQTPNMTVVCPIILENRYRTTRLLILLVPF